MDKDKNSNNAKVKQLIYFGDVSLKYICGPCNLDNFKPASVETLLKECINKSFVTDFLKSIEKASEDRLLPRREQLFQILCKAMIHEEATTNVKISIRETAFKIIKSDSDLGLYVKYCTMFKAEKSDSKSKLGKSARKVVKSYYNSKDSEELVASYVANKSINGWSHKDLIKYCHVKSKNPLYNIVTQYILFNELKTAPSALAEPLINRLKKIDTLRSALDPKIAIPLISELKATVDQVHPSLKWALEIWKSALPNMQLSDLLKALPKLYKKGWLKKDSYIQNKVNEILVDTPTIKASGLHPIEIFIYMKNFEKGGSPIDPKLLQYLKDERHYDEEKLSQLSAPVVVKAHAVLSNLTRCMNIACTNNVQSLGKRYLITVDTTKNMEDSCLGTKNVAGVEAAAAFVWYLLRSEKDVTVAVFKEKDIEIISLDKRGNWSDHLKIFKEKKCEYLMPVAPVEWATHQKKHFDIFLNFIHQYTCHFSIPKDVKAKMPKCEEALKKYAKKVNLPNAKLINYCTTSHRLCISEGTGNVFDLAGLDSTVPKALEVICRGNFC